MSEGNAYYRYEAKIEGEDDRWYGICAYLDPDCRRKLARYIAEPKWYKTHSDMDSKCWFTEYGYQKYSWLMDELVEDMTELMSDSGLERFRVRVLRAKALGEVYCAGKVQTISSPEAMGEVLREYTAADIVYGHVNTKTA